MSWKAAGGCCARTADPKWRSKANEGKKGGRNASGRKLEKKSHTDGSVVTCPGNTGQRHQDWTVHSGHTHSTLFRACKSRILYLGTTCMRCLNKMQMQIGDRLPQNYKHQRPSSPFGSGYLCRLSRPGVNKRWRKCENG